MTVVSDSSPLIVLAKVGWHHLLKALFGEILISPTWGQDKLKHVPPGATSTCVA